MAGAQLQQAEPVAADAAPVLPAQAHEFSEREHALREQLQAVSVAAAQEDLAKAADRSSPLKLPHGYQICKKPIHRKNNITQDKNTSYLRKIW